MKEFSLIATGDSLITMKQSVHHEPNFVRLVELIRGVDCAFANLEMNLHDYESECYPAAECGGTYTRAHPSILGELQWMGFDVFSTANNHSMDYMYGGLLKTIEHLKEANVTYAGTGRNLAEARSPGYYESSNGRVGIVSACSTFSNFGRAGEQRRDLHGRPGLNPLRYLKWYEAKAETIDKLKQVQEELNIPRVKQAPDNFILMNTKYVEGDNVGLHTQPHPGDLEGNLEAIRDARKQADWVIFSHHAHEGYPGNTERPAEFMEDTARAVIDEGAHCVIGHGHHAMRGIEIRDGKPIFYSLGDFIFQNETVYKMPSDFYEKVGMDPFSGMVSDAYDARQKATGDYGMPSGKWFTDDEKYWISIVPRMEFKGDKLSDLYLYPIELGMDKPRSQRGRPQIATGEKAAQILDIIEKLSKPYGTRMEVVDDVGVVWL